MAAPTKLPDPPKVQTEGKPKAPEEQKSASAVPATSTTKDTAASKEAVVTKPIAATKDTATSKETAATKPVSRVFRKKIEISLYPSLP